MPCCSMKHTKHEICHVLGLESNLQGSLRGWARDPVLVQVWVQRMAINGVLRMLTFGCTSRQEHCHDWLVSLHATVRCQAMPGTACSAAQGSCDFSDGAIGDTCMLAQCAWRLSPSVAPFGRQYVWSASQSQLSRTSRSHPAVTR